MAEYSDLRSLEVIENVIQTKFAYHLVVLL